MSFLFESDKKKSCEQVGCWPFCNWAVHPITKASQEREDIKTPTAIADDSTVGNLHEKNAQFS